ncbi:MAG: ATP-dependent DNA helicase RecG [Nocardiopsaceae bacterium]|nr:ATP-dependent DNA helicase RecG [Nocardiopsaceae bacterium]
MLARVTTLSDQLVKVLGPTTGRKLAAAFGLETVEDLLRHYPRRHYSRGELTNLAELTEDDHVTVLARVDKVSRRQLPPPRPRRGAKGGARPREMLEVVVTDGTGTLRLTFFGRVSYFARDLYPGAEGMFAGTVSTFKGQRQLVHPEFELLPREADSSEAAAGFAGALVPVYPASAKMTTWAISRCVRDVLDNLVIEDDPLPGPLRRSRGLLPLADALRAIHRPRDRAELGRAEKRLRWDEAFVMQAALAQRRKAAAAMPAVPRPPEPDGIAAEFDRRLPFALTEGQRRAGETIARDLACAYPMNRLLQGDVGSGKTVVAVRAMLQVVDAGGQAALLAPTEVLAQQHYRSITALLGPLAEGGTIGAPEPSTRVALLTGSTGVRDRRRILTDAFTGDAGILIGTHALLEDQVRFAELGLVVIDEQHRFGVEQRDALREKAEGARPHVLVMTATPIPRTVAMTVFGDLEISTMTGLPAGRSPIATHVVPAVEKPKYLDRAWARLREEVAAGRQAYVVCPRIGDDQPDEGPAPDAGAPGGSDGSDGSDGAGRAGPGRPPLAVLDVGPALAAGPLSGLRVEILHGRLRPEEKDRLMSAFKAGEIDVLVSTTVIEVGVDVPNATVMVILDADRFGVSQLHQLRGRVGRGGQPGLCLLVTESGAETARERLDAVAETTDGFELSRLDLAQRKEGDVLGSAQSGGRRSLRLLRLLRDEDLIGLAREEATALVDSDPELAGHPALAASIAAMLDPERAEYLDKS